MEVNKERIKLWVAALRSKRFKQIQGQLAISGGGKTYEHHCCLGVGCEVAKENGLRFRFDGANGDLPERVVRWFGFSSPDPMLTDSLTCTDGNDRVDYSFRKIATLIERRYLKPAKAKKASK